MSFATDAFTGTEDTELSAYSGSWSKQSGSTGNAEISGNRLRQTNNTTASYLHSATPPSADYAVECDVYVPSGGDGAQAAGVWARALSASGTGYHARYNGQPATPEIQLYRFNSGSATLIGSGVGVTRPANDSSTKLRLEVSGTGATVSLVVKWGGSAVITQSDTSGSRLTATGLSGLRFLAPSVAPTDSVGTHVDNFLAEDLGAGPSSSVAPIAHYLRMMGSA